MELKERYLKGVSIVKDSRSDSAIIGHMYEVRLVSRPYENVQPIAIEQVQQMCRIAKCAPSHLPATCFCMQGRSAAYSA